ncbi:acetyl-CoA carboxylase biotin carboxylase subunit [Desulforhopalus singaporensis]|uniref:Acetyl-CoA carboxylase, biotin carboxylase subunit n=1 Tax=Desulforhopalus singaporensis TaxID=91360 RepID=A0A1H0NE15_9BACT|nr:biotin carboxylase N-terminal domain-containing protein [Desulforhopalus singaporensis]SDO90972.1 acetyl-CoA carboxylase, biotin carboxylase subunit [Desulforhopalus singaporensis]
MKTRILVANRGEIAIRLIRAIQELGYEAIAVYETPDEMSSHIRIADEAVCLGPGPRSDYLNIDKIIRAAKKSGAAAIHPGYGFLAENPYFAKACEASGVIFIGPSSEIISNLGNKVIARKIMGDAKIPMVPGTANLSQGKEGIREALGFAEKYGYPVMLKATSGGGGRGIRRIESDKDMVEQIPVARAEALAAFNDDSVYLEKVVVNPKHVEVQILADSFGKTLHLGTRDCSIQRRNQKLVEIAPSMIQNKELLDNICETAVLAAKAANYLNAGTVEFLIDSDMNYYFMEINTRVQVEHTVTEMITGIDIVRNQINIAFGKPLSFGQEDVNIRGHAIEVRINAEDPKNNFMPEGGKKVSVYRSTGGFGVRLDGFVYQGYIIPEVYDSLLVKLTVHGFTWEETVGRLRRCLANFTISGPKTTIPFYQNIANERDFVNGDFDTSYIDTHPYIFHYEEDSSEASKLARFVAEIHYAKENPFAK